MDKENYEAQQGNSSSTDNDYVGYEYNKKTDSKNSVQQQYYNVNLESHPSAGINAAQIPLGLDNPLSSVRQQYRTVDLESDPPDLKSFEDSVDRTTQTPLGLDNNPQSLVGQQYHNIKLGSHPPDDFEDNTVQNPLELDNSINDDTRGKFTILREKVFHCLCPFIPIIRALLSCDMETFWKMVPLILGAKAFYSSCISLGLCTLFKVQRVNLQYDIMDDESSNVLEESYFFGLWTYTGNIQIGESMGDFVTKEVERIETCRFHMNEVDDQTPDRLFLNDTIFNIARSFAIAATVLGFFSTVSVYVSAANCSISCRGSRIWPLFSSLVACGIFESLTFLVLASSVCRDIEDIEFKDERRCSLEEGVGIIFVSCFCWFTTAFALLKMPRNGDTDDCIACAKVTPIIECVDTVDNDRPDKECVEIFEQEGETEYCSKDETVPKLSLHNTLYC